MHMKKIVLMMKKPDKELVLIKKCLERDLYFRAAFKDRSLQSVN